MHTQARDATYLVPRARLTEEGAPMRCSYRLYERVKEATNSSLALRSQGRMPNSETKLPGAGELTDERGGVVHECMEKRPVSAF